MPTTYAIPDGRTVMAATLWTGNNASRSISNSVNGVSFQPDFVWIKDRSRISSNDLVDSVRGVNLAVISDAATAEYTGSFVSSFNSDGFSLPANTTSDNFYTNISGDTFVGWQWKGGGSPVSNTAGSITSQVSANTTAGFSVVSYTLNNSTFTVGHGLGVTPSMILVKNRDTVNNWDVYHVSVGAGYRLQLNQTAAQQSSTQVWNNTAPTSTVFSGNSAWWSSPSTSKMIAYCFAPVAGFSAFGSYAGNSSTDGPFVYLGFRPRWLLIKSSSAAGTWTLWDSSRSTANSTNLTLAPNSSAVEGSGINIDFLSNGFKVRHIGDINVSGVTSIYAAFAENPFKYANAR